MPLLFHIAISDQNRELDAILRYSGSSICAETTYTTR